MTEMLAALLGALVGGLLSAGVGAWQTGKVLRHETEMAATERREATRVDEERRQSLAADQLISALAAFVTVTRDDHVERAVYFSRMMATSDVHRNRNARASALMQASSSHAHAIPREVRERWDALIWMVRFCGSKQEARSDTLRRRDASDLLNYVEYVRQSLCAVSENTHVPPHYPGPNVRRDDGRIWGFRPERDSTSEPDLTDWHFSSRLIGEVTFNTGEVRWYGPNGYVEDLPHPTGQNDGEGEGGRT